MNRRVYAVLALLAPLWNSMAELSISRYDGWGRWAAAPLLMMPLLYGLLIGVIGLALVYLARRSRQPLGWWLGWSLVAFYPVWLVLLRQL